MKSIDTLYLFAAIFLGYQKNYKRMFAYSTMENMNIALIGLSTFTLAGLVGSLLLLLSHSFGKAGAFYSSGNVFEMSGTKSIDSVGGLIRNRASATSMLLSSFAVTGTPPFGTFFGEFLILYSVLSIHFYAQFSIIVLSLFLAFVSINFNISKMLFRGEVRIQPVRHQYCYTSYSSNNFHIHRNCIPGGVS